MPQGGWLSVTAQSVVQPLGSTCWIPAGRIGDRTGLSLSTLVSPLLSPTNDLCLSYGQCAVCPPVVTWPGTTTKMKRKVVWYRRGYEWVGGSRVGPTGVADFSDDKHPLTVTCMKVEARLSPYPGQPKNRHCIRWGSVLERSVVGYVWYRCGCVEPCVRGGLFQSSRVLV